VIGIRRKNSAQSQSQSQLCDALMGLAHVQSLMSKVNEAIQSCTEGYTILVKAVGPMNPTVAQYLIQMASFHEMRSNYKESQSNLEQAYSVVCSTLGPQHPSAAACASSLTMLHRTVGNVAEAKRWGSIVQELKDKHAVAAGDNVDARAPF